MKAEKQNPLCYYFTIGAGKLQVEGMIFIGKTVMISNWERLPEVLSLHYVALIFGISDSTVKRWVTNGTLPARKIGKLWFFNKSEIKSLLQGGDSA